MSDGPDPCLPSEAVLRAYSMLNEPYPYLLGTGGYDPKMAGALDVPWTLKDGQLGSDCAGFVVWCYKLPRHRPGYNRGAWSSVEDDLNVSSMIEDSEHGQELFVPAGKPRPGDMLAYPTIRLPGLPNVWIGHICIVVGVARCLEWDPDHPDYSSLDVLHCHGPNGRKPAVTAGSGSIWDVHDDHWPKLEHRTRMIRVRG